MYDFIETDERVKVGVNQLTRGSEQAAGYDITVWPEEPVSLDPNVTYLFPTGFKLHIGWPDIVGKVYPRSSLGVKKGLVLANTVGVIDPDYQGEWMVCLRNTKPLDYTTIFPGDRVAQVVFERFEAGMTFNRVKEFEETVRGEGGFGSTGER